MELTAKRHFDRSPSRQSQVKSGRVTVFPPEHGEMQAGMLVCTRVLRGPVANAADPGLCAVLGQGGTFERCQNRWNKANIID